MIFIEQIRKKLIEAIQQSGMTKTELAKKIGVCHQAIGQYLYQNKMPALDTFANLCEVLDLDANDILCIGAYSSNKASYEFEYQHADTKLIHKENKK